MPVTFKRLPDLHLRIFTIANLEPSALFCRPTPSCDLVHRTSSVQRSCIAFASAELRDEFFHRSHGRPVYDFNILRKVIGVHATEPAAGEDCFQEPLRISGS